ncbi:MAG: leucine zipper domain-containing protein [Planctomycetes bacterium]|nr:leucine zipper domain-containing protein [Planctomycetota bacterium]
MPWKGVTVSEARQQFLKDYWLGYYTISDLADRHMVSRKTAHKWIERVKRYGEEGFHELSRRPLHSAKDAAHSGPG